MFRMIGEKEGLSIVTKVEKVEGAVAQTVFSGSQTRELSARE